MSSRKRTRRRPSRASSSPSSGEEVVVRLAGPQDLVASLPSMLGFVPEDSFVVVAMHRHGGRSRVGGMARVDLVPRAEPHERAEVDRVLVAAVRQRLEPAAPDSLVVVVVADTDPDGEPPHRALVAALRESFDEIGVPVTGAVWAARVAEGAPWACYDDCGCTGTVSDPTGTLAAAETAAAGRVTYGSRSEAEAVLAPDPAANSPRRRELVDDAHEAALTDRELSGVTAARRDLEAVRHAVAEVGRGVVLAEEEIARLAVALCDPRVRDVCLGFAAGHDDAVDPAHAEQLWTLLARAVPAPEVAEPATLLAFATLDHGGGAALTTALVRAMDADPGHQLSRLLGSIVAAGIDPATVREMIAGAAAESAARLVA
ncbi:DUF4192 domain-containing protein [Actinomycetospora sp. TBRC 11914]|uniref:DUF4192 domain-containing protein n=1 Tax=Actinomycetospora sp. TBRC 11914 TaxID=2729387 RepID=UPI00145CF662|nr:DUF4192 domain-containing protein [Actinomycetospora sp. TBRC 11914]NMO89840.1 DUF4192 domain-containing protein [Actinomycetospora sp. TBRC 11914]